MLLPGRGDRMRPGLLPGQQQRQGPTQPRRHPESLHLHQPCLACFPNPTGRVSGCWKRAKAPGQWGEGIPWHQSRQDAVPTRAHTAHLPFPAPKTRAKTPGEMLSVGTTTGCLLTAFQCPQGLCSTHKTRSRGLRALAHGWQSPYAAVEHPVFPLGHHLRVPSAAGFALVLGGSYVRERESGGGEPGFIGQKMEVRGS